MQNTKKKINKKIALLNCVLLIIKQEHKHEYDLWKKAPAKQVPLNRQS